jgi:putative endonuclease
MPFAVYVMTNKTGRVLYTGFSSELAERVVAHKKKLFAGFTARYNVDRLVYYETTDNREAALAREKQIKAGSRASKIALINSINPDWRDLSDEL